MKNNIDIRTIKNRYTYEEYKNLNARLAEEGKTSGPVQSGVLIEFTKLNMYRLFRVDKTMVVKNDVRRLIEAISEKKYWVLITEAWCGDAAQTVPIIGNLAKLNDNIELLVILRDENPQIMDKYLTNGTAKSIPVLISLNEKFEEEWHWGPRPKPAQAMVMGNKEAINPLPSDELKKNLQLWYAEDKTFTTQEEISSLILKSYAEKNDSMKDVKQIEKQSSEFVN